MQKNKSNNKVARALLRVIAIMILGAIATLSIITSTGCYDSEADRVAHNLSQQADNFNIVRRLTVINCITGDTLFVMEGKMSVTDAGNVLRIYVEDNGVYKKHMVGLSDNVTYTLEDLSGKDVSKYHYTINFNPKMWIPFDFDNVD